VSDYDVLLLGSYYCDLIFNGLPELPRLGLDLFGTGFDLVAGGSYRTSNALKRLGLRAGWLVDFGDDTFSRLVLDMAARDGLDDSLFRHHPFPVRRISVAFSFVHDRGFISYADPLPPPVAVDTIRAHRPRAVLISHLEYGPDHEALVAVCLYGLSIGGGQPGHAGRARGRGARGRFWAKRVRGAAFDGRANRGSRAGAVGGDCAGGGDQTRRARGAGARG